MKKDIIACRIFENELTAVLDEDELPKIHWIEAALHADPAKMESAISQTLSEKIAPGSGICFLFGNGCHPDMPDITRKCHAGLPLEKNCIHAFLGPEQTKELEKNRTMVITPGWLDAWQGIMSAMGWDEVDVRINMGLYDRILLLDPGLVPIDDEALILFYDLVQVPVEIMEISLDYFKAFVRKITVNEAL